MIVFKDYITFMVKGQEINLISDEINCSYNTIAEINNVYYYLGNEFPNVLAAVLAWEELNDETLSSEELSQVMVENKLVSDAI